MPTVDGIDYTSSGAYNALDFIAKGGVYQTDAGTGPFGHYRLGKIGQRWVVVDPAGKVSYWRGLYRINSQLDSHVFPAAAEAPQAGRSLSTTREAKYTGGGTTWAQATTARLKRCHYNAQGIHWQTGDVGLPVVNLGNKGREAQLAATATQAAGVTEPIKDIIKACKSSGLAAQTVTAWWNRSCGDWFDPKYKLYIDSSFGWNSPTKWYYQGGVLFLHHDDGDYSSQFMGNGVANEVTYVVSENTGVVHTGMVALIGRLTGITSQTIYLSSVPNTFSTDTGNHTKQKLLDDLTAKYGTIGALNTAWGTGGYYTAFGTDGGWGVGTGVADEDGLRPRTWFGSNGPSTNVHVVGQNELFDSTQWNPNVKIDLDNMYFKIVEAYLKPVYDRIKAINPGILFAGTTLGAGFAVRTPVLQAVAKYQDLALGGAYNIGGTPLADNLREPATNLMRSRMKTPNPDVGYAGGRELPLIHTLYNPCGADSALYWDNTNNALSQQAQTQVARGQAHKTFVLQALNYRDAEGIYPYIGFMQWGFYDQIGEHRGWGIMSPNENLYDGGDYRVAKPDPYAPDRTIFTENRVYGDTLGLAGGTTLVRTDLIIGAHQAIPTILESQFGDLVDPDTTPPTAPGTLSALQINAQSLWVQWVAATDPGSPASGIKEYRVGIRATLVGGAYTLVGTTAATNLVIQNLTPETSYDVQVFAVDNAFPANLVSATASEGTFVTIAASDEPVSFVGVAAALANTVTLPAHQTGDVLLILARRNNSATPPTLPAGWTAIRSGTGASNVAAIVGYKIAASSSETSGTWTNAGTLAAAVYRGNSGIGASAILTGGTGAAAIMPALALQITDGSSWVVGFNARSTATGAEPTAVTGMTLRTEATTATPRGSVLDTNGPVGAWADATSDIGNSGWVNIVVEVKASGAPPPTIDDPTVAITSPAAAATVSGLIAVLTAIVDLNGSGIVAAELYVDDVLIATINPALDTFQLDTTQFTEASHVLHVVVRDNLGKTGTSADVTVTVDQPAAVTTRRAEVSWLQLRAPDPPTPSVGTAKPRIQWDRGPDSAAYEVTQDGVVVFTLQQVAVGSIPEYIATVTTGAVVSFEIRHVYADGSKSAPLAKTLRSIKAAPTGFRVADTEFFT